MSLKSTRGDYWLSWKRLKWRRMNIMTKTTNRLKRKQPVEEEEMYRRVSKWTSLTPNSRFP